MATVINRPNGRRWVQFERHDGKRHTIRLGKLSSREAETFRAHIEHLAHAKAIGASPDLNTSQWLAGVGDKLRGRIERTGIARAQVRRDVTLAKMLDEFFASLTIKDGTLATYEQTRRSLLEYFGASKLVREIGPLDAEKWRQHMKAQDLAQATISKRVKTARQAFRRAGKWEMVDANPFDDVRAGTQANKARMRFVSRADAQKVLDACPDGEWRLIFALSRYGGLRCPSEHLLLKWSDVDWTNGRMRVTSPKTEGYEGAEFRFTPIFPELLPHLKAQFDAAADRQDYVIAGRRGKEKNLRSQMKRIIARAGLTPWPKLFHNLRSTRQTELAEKHPIHLVCAWLGNSAAIAQAHYLQVTDADFERAAKSEVKSEVLNSPTESYGKINKFQKQQNQPENGAGSAACDSLSQFILTPTGFEPVSRP